VEGNVSVTISSLAGSVSAGADKDTLASGDGNDVLTGDQAVVIAGVVDARTGSHTGSVTWTLSAQVGELVDGFTASADDDVLTAGNDNDLVVGDSQAMVSAFRGAFAAPLAAAVQLTGTQLVESLDVHAGRDTLHGGTGNDTLVGDSATSVVPASGGLLSGMVSALSRLIDRLNVSSATDTLTGEGGSDTLDSGNLATASTPLVRSASVSAKDSGTPSAPVIDWNGRLDPVVPAPSNSAWLESFVNGLGREENPNTNIRIEL
jgi:Ca2+-binding RTX toxin-like protein